MKRLGLLIGMVAFWVGWPVLWVYFRRGKRTRLLIVCKNEFLALQGWIGPGSWSLPGGGLHRHEDTVIGLMREVYEETGIQVQKESLQFAYEAMHKQYGLQFSYSSYVLELDEKPPISLQHKEIAASAWQPIIGPNLPLAQDAAKLVAWWRNKV